jgi:hypothetical protein
VFDRTARVGVSVSICALLFFATAIAAPSADVATVSARAAEAYDAGDCARVLTLYEGVAENERSALDGLSHYRWGFCLGALRRGDPQAHFRRAVEALSAATKNGGSLDERFYLVNAHLNLRETDEARAQANAAVEAYRAGSLSVPENDPNAWFRLGKLFREAGRLEEATTPYRRAIETAAKEGNELSDAYLERIADGARIAGDLELAKTAQEMLTGGEPPKSPRDLLREGRRLVADEKYEQARELFNEARKARGAVGMIAQYSEQTVERILEVQRFGLAPATTLPDGTPIDVVDLRPALAEGAQRAWKVIREGETKEVKRKRGEGTRLAPTDETKQEIWLNQAEFVGLLRRGVLVGADLRGWAIADGYAPLIHKKWIRIFRHQLDRRQAAPAEAKDES